MNRGLRDRELPHIPCDISNFAWNNIPKSQKSKFHKKLQKFLYDVKAERCYIGKAGMSIQIWIHFKEET